ncbi:MAG TPA: hypothetical protein VK841_07505 [Polyangiaceae bacterium]|nr:hypothetical protein [Polyangiaceae bacterium]
MRARKSLRLLEQASPKLTVSSPHAFCAVFAESLPSRIAASSASRIVSASSFVTSAIVFAPMVGEIHFPQRYPLSPVVTMPRSRQ